MKIVVDRAQLLKAWQIAMKYAAQKSPMESLTGIRVTAYPEGTITLEATDLKSAVKYSVKGQVDASGEIVLNASIFGEILKKAGTEQVELETTAKRGTLTTERSRMRFSVIPEETYPKLPASEEAEDICELDAEAFMRIVVEGSSGASNPSEFPRYMGTCLLRTTEGKLQAVATDGKRLSRSQEQCDVNIEMDMLLPASNVRDVVRNLTGNGRVRVKADASTVWFLVDGAEYSIRQIEATFPNYEKILKEEYVATLEASRKSLIQALERVAVIAKNTPEKLMAMSMKGGLVLRARAAGVGTTQELVEGVKLEGAELSIGFNVNLLLEGLMAASCNEVLIEFSGEDEQARIYERDSRDFLYMLMPLRLSEQDLADDVNDEDEVNDGLPETE